MLGDSIGARILTSVGSYKSNSSGALLNTHPRNALRFTNASQERNRVVSSAFHRVKLWRTPQEHCLDAIYRHSNGCNLMCCLQVGTDNVTYLSDSGAESRMITTE